MLHTGYDRESNVLGAAARKRRKGIAKDVVYGLHGVKAGWVRLRAPRDERKHRYNSGQQQPEQPAVSIGGSSTTTNDSSGSNETNSAEGLFWMPLDDFAQIFDTIVWCRTFDQDAWAVQAFRARSRAGGDLTSPSWYAGDQFTLTVNSNSTHLSLSAYVSKSEDGQDADGSEEETPDRPSSGPALIAAALTEAADPDDDAEADARDERSGQIGTGEAAATAAASAAAAAAAAAASAAFGPAGGISLAVVKHDFGRPPAEGPDAIETRPLTLVLKDTIRATAEYDLNKNSCTVDCVLEPGKYIVIVLGRPAGRVLDFALLARVAQHRGEAPRAVLTGGRDVDWQDRSEARDMALSAGGGDKARPAELRLWTRQRDAVPGVLMPVPAVTARQQHLHALLATLLDVKHTLS